MARPKRVDKKEQRYTLLVRPVLWDAIEQRATVEGVTVNRLIELALEQFMPTTPPQSAALPTAAPCSR